MELRIFCVAFFGLSALCFTFIRIGIIEISGSTGAFFFNNAMYFAVASWLIAVFIWWRFFKSE